MSNFTAVVDVLFRHREARQWSDEAVARDVLAILGVDPDGGNGIELAVVAEVEAAAPVAPVVEENAVIPAA